MRITHHPSFEKIAREHLKNATELNDTIQGKINNLDSQTSLSEEERNGEEAINVDPLRTQMSSSCLITIVFAALYTEAFIYDYLAKNLSDNFVEEHLDKTDVTSKWVLSSKLIVGKDFPKDKHPFQLLKQLVKDRNTIVHSKSTNLLDFNQESENPILTAKVKEKYKFSSELLKKASDAIRTLDELAKTIQQLDPSERMVSVTSLQKNKRHKK